MSNRLSLPADREARDAIISENIIAWRKKPKEERIAEAFTRDELRSMAVEERLFVLHNGLLDSLMGHYALHPKMDSSPGVLLIVMMLSDNGDYGALYMSTSRIGKMLSRGRNVIGRDLAILVDEGWLIREERKGTSALYYPVFSRDFSASARRFQYINVYAPAPAKGGRPRTRPVEIADVGDETPAPAYECNGFQKPLHPHTSATVSPDSKALAPEDQNPCTPMRVHDSSNWDLSNGGGDARARELLEGADFDEHNQQYNQWGTPTPTAFGRDVTDPSLLSLVSAHAAVAERQPFIVQQAVRETHTTCRSMIVSGSVRNKGPRAYTAYFQRLLTGNVHAGMERVAKTKINIDRAANPHYVNGRADQSAINRELREEWSQ